METKTPVRISISEASRLFGVSTTTIRKALKNDEFKYIVVRGRYRLDFESLTQWSQKSTRRKNQFNNKGIGQFISKWKIHNKLYSPNPELTEQKQEEKDNRDHWQPL